MYKIVLSYWQGEDGSDATLCSICNGCSEMNRSLTLLSKLDFTRRVRTQYCILPLFIFYKANQRLYGKTPLKTCNFLYMN